MKVFLITLLCLFKIIDGQVIVDLPNGLINGRVEVTQNANKTYYVFLQIPYGKAPVGKLRFQAPEPAEKWEGILDCTKNERICHQVGLDHPFENEDCLYINIYSPVPPGSKANLPVMFYIFGGGFVQGSAVFTPNAPQFFMEQDVIVIEVSYRIGPFGFLTTNDNVISGNNGLKDQNLALQWVQQNINLFGGDPGKVTIFGQSAGGASVTYHILSKQSAGLFRGAIAQSGTALCPWAYQRNAKSIAYTLASLIDSNFNSNSTTDQLLEIFQNFDAKDIDRESSNVPIDGEEIIQGFRYTPTIEPDIPGAFITDTMYNIVDQGDINKVPLLIGFCSEEAVGQAADLEAFRIGVQKYDNDVKKLVTDNFHILNDDLKNFLGSIIRHFYTDGMFSDNLGAAVRFFSDTCFNRGVMHYAHLQAKYTNVYFYQFSYHGLLGGNNAYVEGADRVAHTEDLRYLWANDVTDIPESDYVTIQRYVKLLTDFAKTLNPTPEPSDIMQNVTIPPIQKENFEYLNINDTLEIKKDLKGNQYKEWVDLFNKWAIKPLDTF